MNAPDHHPAVRADTASRMAVLEAVYRLYDQFAAGLDLFCHRGCAHCCTANVTLTSLEGRYLFDFIRHNAPSHLLRRITALPGGGGRRVPLTTNALARLCAEGQTPQEETDSAPAGRCPLLEQEVCPVYAARPFACRCLVSTADCGATGYAAMDDFTLSLNTVFLQCIEHLDAGGWSGSLGVMLGYMEKEAGNLSGDLPGLAANSPLTILMVPPEHREAMAPWLEKLRLAMVPPPSSNRTIPHR